MALDKRKRTGGELTNVTVDEVSLVDKPACKGAYIRLMKSDIRPDAAGEGANMAASDVVQILKAADEPDRRKTIAALVKSAGDDGEMIAAVESIALDSGFDVEILKALETKAQQAAVNIFASTKGHAANPYAREKAAAEATVQARVAKSGEVPAWRELEQLASAIAKRENVTKEAAVGKAAEENPDVYRRYLVETAR